jgi:UDP-4-amino-4,6-dideoxy-N-acetyl-beta-L-altrosamine N-acetyltransferase
MATQSLKLVPIHQLETETQLAIREIRNDPEVRKVVYTDHIIGVNEHLQWIARLKADRTKIVFGIMDEAHGRAIRVSSFTALDVKNKRSDWGFYLAPKERGRGIGTAVERRFLEFAFETLGLEKLNGTVLEGNDATVRFYKRFGFEEEGFRRSEIEKNGTRIGVHLLGLRKQDWDRCKSEIDNAYREIFERFAIEIRWAPEDESLSAIDQIEAARAKNNVNWMNILRIAVEKSPANAKQIIAEIKELDQQISALTAQIELEP